MKVELQYFRQSGKWYMDEEYDTDIEDLADIWDEVRERNKGTGFNILVNVPDHEHAHPKFLMSVFHHTVGR